MADDGNTQDQHDDGTESASAPVAQTTATVDPEATLGDAGKKALDAMKAERNAASSRAKALEKEIGELRKSQMGEAERAVAEAEERGRTTALGKLGQRLVLSEFKAAAAGKSLPVGEWLEDLNLSKYVGPDGEPDTKAISTTVERFATLRGDRQVPSYDGGTRRAADKPVDMNRFIRDRVNRE
jgi:hypothetical protein